MKRRTYPICLNLSGRHALVAGAGKVAARKIERLLEADALVHVVAPDACTAVHRAAEQGRLALSLREVRDADANDAFLVLCATDDAGANEALAKAARAAGALVSRVDAPEDSDFTVPAKVTADSVEATISTFGAAPSAARRLSRELGRWLAHGPDRFARELGRARTLLRGKPNATEKLHKLANGPLFDACAASNEVVIQELLESALTDPVPNVDGGSERPS